MGRSHRLDLFTDGYIIELLKPLIFIEAITENTTKSLNPNKTIFKNTLDYNIIYETQYIPLQHINRYIEKIIKLKAFL